MRSLKAGWTATEPSVEYANQWFEVWKRHVTFPDGSPGQYYSVHVPFRSVGVVATREDHILLVRQYRLIVDEESWAIPSGGIDPEESPEEAALRELREETGHSAGGVTSLCRFYPTYGCSDQEFLIFAAHDVSDSGDEASINEVQEVRWFSKTDVLAMMHDGVIVDGLSLPGLWKVLGPPSRDAVRTV